MIIQMLDVSFDAEVYKVFFFCILPRIMMISINNRIVKYISFFAISKYLHLNIIPSYIFL